MVDDHSDRPAPAARRSTGAVRTWRGSAAADARCGLVDVEHRQARRFAAGHRVDVDAWPNKVRLLPTTRPGVVLRHCQRRHRLGSTRGGRHRARRPRPRGQRHSGGHHRRRVIPVLGAGHLDRGATPAADRVRRDAQRGVLDPQVVRSAGKDPGRAGRWICRASTSPPWQRVSGAGRPMSTAPRSSPTSSTRRWRPTGPPSSWCRPTRICHASRLIDNPSKEQHADLHLHHDRIDTDR